MGPSAKPHLTLDKYCGLLKDYLAPALPALNPQSPSFDEALTHNFLDTLAGTALAATGKKIYGEKFTPYRGTASRALAALERYHPKIKFVNLTRDGRDVIASGAAHWLNLRLCRASGGEREELEEALHNRAILAEDFEMFLDYWKDAAQAGLAARERFPHYLHVRYEDFLEEPVTQAEQLFKFLGLKVDSATVRACVDATSFDQLSGGRPRGEEDPASFFRKGIAGDWRNWFTAEQQARFEETAGVLLERLGYTREAAAMCEAAA